MHFQAVRSYLMPAFLALSSLPAVGQIVASAIPFSSSAPPMGLWYIDVATGDRTLLATEWANAIAVDDVGGRVLFAQGAALRQWNYGSAQNGASTVGTIQKANGSALSVSGLAYGGGRLFSTTYSGPWLYEISLSTLVATPVSMPQHFDHVFGLSFDSSSGLFYAAVEGPYTGGGYACDLHSIDLLTGGSPTLVARVPDTGNNACVANGVAYPMAPNKALIGRYDLATGSFSPQAFAAPWITGFVDCGSEFAPGLVPSADARVFCHATAPGGAALPALQPIGIPSASAGSGFVVRHLQVPSAARLQSHYSFAGRSSLPFLSGYRCLRAPVFRIAPVLNSTTSSVYDLDFNVLIAQGVHPSLLAGQTVWYQASLRAPAAYGSGAFAFTPGLEFTIRP